MEKLSVVDLAPEDRNRMAYIENRPDLFETKILHIESQNKADKDKDLLVITRDPGSANALLPVVKELIEDDGLAINVITDGRAQEIIQSHFSTENLTPTDTIFNNNQATEDPELILMDRSSEMGIDTYASANFPEVPKILVEDAYGNTISFLAELIKRNLPLPAKICVMDQECKNLIVQKFPQLETTVEVTGQPAFDRFAKEDTETLALETRQQLGLNETDKLVTFMSTKDEPEKITLMAQSLKELGDSFYFVFRRHPRDNVTYETYHKILSDAGIKVIDTNSLATDAVGAASDVVMTTWSTEGLNAIYRRKPTIFITDDHFRIHEEMTLPLPPVKLGAGVGINRVSEVAGALAQLLDTDSTLNAQLRKNMETHYSADGKNANRVAQVVRGYLK